MIKEKNMWKTDILAFGAHPDDIECAAAGIIINTVKLGGIVVLVDLTKGEMGSHGTVNQRTREAKDAANILGIQRRVQLNFEDSKITNNLNSRKLVIQIIRQYKPRIVLANAFIDRHPDHREAAQLVSDACFLSGLKKNRSIFKGREQQCWRPICVYHYIQDYFVKPDFVVDISKHFEEKMKTIKAYKSQFVNARDNSPDGILALLKQIEATNRIFGRSINVMHAEGFTSARYIGVRDITLIV
ncbi:MAG: bacillithiol biosynthesis deacetylase BshB1 [Chitinophagaceae bacterium]|nr:bacillithiol biosynthesis deacetylase BshB1 [Chitinophagaceae bacterium]